MKRSGPIARYAPLTSTTPLPRSALAANQAGHHRPAKPKRPRDTGPTPALVTQVLIRDDYACCLCGGSAHGRRGVDFSVHHRKLRSQGGRNDLSNLVTLCGSGTTGHHGWAHHNRKAAEADGWIVRSGFNPAAVAINHWQYGLIFLSDAGSWSSRPFSTIAEEATR